MLGFIIFAFTGLCMGDILDWVTIWETYHTRDLEMVFEIRELGSVICRCWQRVEGDNV